MNEDREQLAYDAYDQAELLQNFSSDDYKSIVPDIIITGKLAEDASSGVDPDVPTKEKLEEVGAGPLVDQDGFPVDVTRPILKNEDGSIATEETITVRGVEIGLSDDSRFYNIPTIVDGKRVTDREALYDAATRIRSGDKLPNYESEELAIRGAKARSEFLGATHSKRMEMIEANAPGAFEQGGVVDRTIINGSVRALNQASQLVYELAESELESFTGSVGIRYIDNVTGEEIPIPYMVQLPAAPQFDDREEARGFAEEMLRDISQFTTGFLFTKGAGTGRGALYGRSAFSATLFDPEQGGIVKAMSSGLGLPILEYLNTADDADLESAEGRLRERFQFALEDLGLAGMIDGAISSLRYIRKHPVLMKSLITTMGLSGLVYADEAEAGPGGRIIKRLAAKDKANIAKSLEGLNLPASEVKRVEDEVRRIKSNYPTEDGWAEITVKDVKSKPTVAIKEGTKKVDVEWQPIVYGYEKPRRNKSYARHQQDMTTRTVDDVRDVVNRANNGDQAAKDILAQADWYRSMRSRLRSEFGGLGDVFADLLGATSANTDVRTNWNNGIDVLRRYTNGDFDKEIQAYLARVEAGEKVDPATLTKLFKAGEFPLMTKATGQLYGINSPAATKALLDMFRQIKVGQAPKTINFTGNLIGYGSQPTIDVWAARYLRDAAGLKRIPPPAEQAVAGNHLTGSTIDKPIIGSEFGFGQRIFTDAANAINAEGFVKNYDSSIGDLGPDDLQAVVWFMEKEKWTINGWTNKAGEGGSLDYEAALAGSPERVEIDELRKTINSSGSTPEQKAIAEARLEELKAPVERRIVGVSRERPEQRPTNVEQAELSSEVLNPLKDDPAVVAQQANNSYGLFGNTPERSLNTEVVTRSDFDETNFINNLVDLGRKYDQDAVYVSKVVPTGTQGAMPGLEVFFKSRQEADKAIAMIDSLRQKYDISGGTIITDARYKDRPDVQVDTGEEIAGAVGLRIQYIPEFEGGVPDPDKAMDTFMDIAQDLMEEADVSSTNVLFFENKVFKNTDRPGAEWIEGGVSYEDSIAGRNGISEETGRRRESPADQNVESAGDSGQEPQVE